MPSGSDATRFVFGENMDTISITQLKGVGDKTAALLKKINICSVHDAIMHFPRDYETFGTTTSIADAKIGEMVSVCGQVISTPVVKKVRNLTIISVHVQDYSGQMAITFFNQPYLKNTLKSRTKKGSNIIMGILSGNPQNEPLHYGEVYAL